MSASTTSALIKRNLKRGKVVFISCTLALFLFVTMRTWAITLIDASQFREILENFRDFEKFASVPFDQLITYTGRVAATFSEPMLLVCILVFVISRSSDSISGELARGTMEMIMAQPVGRKQFLLASMVTVWIGIAGICIACYAALYLSAHLNHVTEVERPPAITVPGTELDIPTDWLLEPKTTQVPLADRIDFTTFAPAIIALFSMGFFVAGFTTMLSSFDKYRWRTVGIAVGFVVLQQMIGVIAKAKPELEFLGSFSFFWLYAPELFVSTLANDPDKFWDPILRYGDGYAQAGFTLGIGLLLLLGCAFYVIALRIVTRRDLPAPL